MTKRLWVLGTITLLASACQDGWPDGWEGGAPAPQAEDSAPTGSATSELCSAPTETTCAPFSVDADGTASDLDALQCSFEVLQSGEHGVLLVDADGHDGAWAWDWEIHVSGDRATVLRRGTMVGDDGALHDMVRVESCELVEPSMFDGAMTALDDMVYGEPIAEAVPTHWLADCALVEEVSCD